MSFRWFPQHGYNTISGERKKYFFLTFKASACYFRFLSTLRKNDLTAALLNIPVKSSVFNRKHESSPRTLFALKSCDVSSECESPSRWVVSASDHLMQILEQGLSAVPTSDCWLRLLTWQISKLLVSVRTDFHKIKFRFLKYHNSISTFQLGGTTAIWITFWTSCWFTMFVACIF